MVKKICLKMICWECAFVFTVIALIFTASFARADGGVCATADPMIKITTLPMKEDVRPIMEAISKDVSKATGLDEGFVTYYWQSFDAIYCPGCKNIHIKEPVFVDLYVPGFLTVDERKKIMISLADAIARHTTYSKKEIFIHTHIGEKDQLYINGDIVKNWKQVGGPDDEE